MASYNPVTVYFAVSCDLRHFLPLVCHRPEITCNFLTFCRTGLFLLWLTSKKTLFLSDIYVTVVLMSPAYSVMLLFVLFMVNCTFFNTLSLSCLFLAQVLICCFFFSFLLAHNNYIVYFLKKNDEAFLESHKTSARLIPLNSLSVLVAFCIVLNLKYLFNS